MAKTPLQTYKKGPVTKFHMLRNLLNARDDKKRGIKRTDALRTLCNFMKNVSMEWDLEESEKLTTWYIDSYFKNLEDESRGLQESLQETYNATLLHTLSLWSDVHSLCPLIRNFNLRTLRLADDDTIALVLPQLLFSIKSHKDVLFIDCILNRMDKHPYTIKLFWILVVEVEREALKKLENPLLSCCEGCFFNQMIYNLMFHLGRTEEGREIKASLKNRVIS